MKAIGRGREATPNLDLTLAFDGLGRLASMDGSYGATALGARSFSYDGLGRLETATGPWEQPQGETGAVTWSYTYDVLGNLRSQASQGGATPYTRAWTYGDANRPRFLTGFEEREDGASVASDAMVPDAAGNTASINGEPLVWNGQGRMASKGNDPYATGINYFDWTGKRVMRWFYATQLIYVGDDFEYDTGLELSTKYFFLNGERVATRSIYYEAESAALPAWVYRWLTPLAPAVFPALMGVLALALLALLAMGLGVPLPAWAAAPGVALLACALVAYPQSVARAVIGGGGDPEWHGGHSKGILIYGNDHLGSTRVVIDATGATVETRDYAPFGKTIQETGAFELKHRFTSQPYDDGVELYNYGARMYEPRWGRFVSADELVEGFDSQGLNRYTYVGNNPITLVDPTGTQMFDPGDTWNTGGGRFSPSIQSDMVYSRYHGGSTSAAASPSGDARQTMPRIGLEGAQPISFEALQESIDEFDQLIDALQAEIDVHNQHIDQLKELHDGSDPVATDGWARLWQVIEAFLFRSARDPYGVIPAMRPNLLENSIRLKEERVKELKAAQKDLARLRDALGEAQDQVFMRDVDPFP